MKYSKRLAGLVVGSLLLMGCALLPTRNVYVMFPVQKYQFITKEGDTLIRSGEELKLSVDGVWMSVGEKTLLEDAQQFAVEHGYDIQ